MPEESHEPYAESPESALLLVLGGLGLLAFGVHHFLGVLRLLVIRLEEFPERIAQIGGMVSLGATRHE
jgi:hypothetical protein